ncbi:MAG: hypothetical protein F6K48_24985 [Okeania sp. SIO3H1]|uniref:hypothetical protein n=1 Tax=Okeania sp. SIO1I7 TaxID=2607772 RepID=UPI0013C817A3|nr:hypothetical protein [Okeania sp. SIO1I7]NEN91982.1 hypothetical protein [Okeania sp. SIO3H1]NET27843.1 hypothetical protein [Okeania sp. SIO1I7]
METLPINLDNKTLKKIDVLSKKQNLSPSQIAKLAIEFCSLLPPSVWLNSNVVSGAEKVEMANILAQAILESQYHEAIDKIKPQLDREWLDSLVTEDDILNAAVELTQDD